MSLMHAMSIVEAKYAAVIGFEPMGQKKSKIVPNDHIIVVDPNLLSQDTDPTRTPKLMFVIRFLAQASLSSHLKILFQVMHQKQHLHSASALPNRDRGESHLSSPPTPPDMRVPHPAVRTD
jgi:hypothetical protein